MAASKVEEGEVVYGLYATETGSVVLLGDSVWFDEYDICFNLSDDESEDGTALLTREALNSNWLHSMYCSESGDPNIRAVWEELDGAGSDHKEELDGAGSDHEEELDGAGSDYEEELDGAGSDQQCTQEENDWWEERMWNHFPSSWTDIQDEACLFIDFSPAFWDSVFQDLVFAATHGSYYDPRDAVISVMRSGFQLAGFLPDGTPRPISPATARFTATDRNNWWRSELPEWDIECNYARDASDTGHCFIKFNHHPCADASDIRVPDEAHTDASITIKRTSYHFGRESTDTYTAYLVRNLTDDERSFA